VVGDTVCSTRAATRGHISVSALGTLRSCYRIAHSLLLHWYYVCRVLTTFYLAFEIAGGVVLSNAAHRVDDSQSVLTSLFPGLSKLPAALSHLPVFCLATCECSVLLATFAHIVLHSTALVLEMVRVHRLRLEQDIALSFTAAHCLCAGLVAAFLGSGLPLYRMAVLHRIPFIYMLKWMKTWCCIDSPASRLCPVLGLFYLDLLLILFQQLYYPGTVRLEDGATPLCLLDCPKLWAEEAGLVDEQSSEDDELSDEDAPGIKLYRCHCFLLSKVSVKLAPFAYIVSAVLCECASDQQDVLQQQANHEVHHC